jgi:hypothetical protein
MGWLADMAPIQQHRGLGRFPTRTIIGRSGLAITERFSGGINPLVGGEPIAL